MHMKCKYQYLIFYILAVRDGVLSYNNSVLCCLIVTIILDSVTINIILPKYVCSVKLLTVDKGRTADNSTAHINPPAVL